MAYLLILPIVLYIALSTATLSRQPRTSASLTLVLYVCSVAVCSAGYLVMGTTNSRSLAEVVSVLTFITGAWSYSVLLPLLLVSLYFQSWFQQYSRRLFGIMSVSGALVTVGLFWIRYTQGYALVLPVTSNAWTSWFMSYWGYYWPQNLLMLLVYQTVTIVLIMIALHYQRISLWRGALPLTLVSLSHSLIPFFAPLAGAEWLVTLSALRFLPLALLLSALLIKARQALTLGQLVHTTLQTRSDITMVLDEQRRVIWQSFHSTRLLGVEPPQSVAPPHLFEHLRASAALPVIRRMLETNTAQGESLIHLDDGEHILEVELQALDDLRDLPNAQLLFVRDVTTLRVRSNLEERRRELLMVSAISADIASSLDVAQIIDRAVQQTLTVNNADMVAVYVLDNGGSSPLRREKCLGDPEVVALIPEILPLENTIAGQAVQGNQTVIITDAHNGGSLSGRLTERGLRSGITIPIAAHDHVVGVLQLGYRARREFDMVQVALLESVGRQLAIALDNARLFRQELEQRKLAEVLRQVASTMATPPLREALTTILGLLRELIDYERASLLLIDTPGCLRIGAQQGFVIDPEAVPLDMVRIDIADYPYLVRLFDERTAQIVSDIPSDHQWKTNEFRYNSWMGVPLISHDQVIGCFSITHQRAGHLTEHDLRIATIFANQTAMVVENARLFETEQRRRVYAEQLQKTSYELVTSRSLDAALSTVLVRLKDLLEFDRANIGLINESRQVWVAYTSHPAGTLPVSTIPLANNPLMQQIVETKNPVLIHDTQASPSSITQQAMWSEARSWMGLPLVVRDRVIGILSVYRVQPQGFSDEQFQIARTFANQVAAAFENFRLLEEANRQNRALSALNMVLSVSNEALTHENLLGVLLERVLDTLNLKYGVIHQYYVGSHELRLRAVSGLPVALVDPLNHIPTLGLEDMTLPPIVLPSGERYIFFSVPLVSHRVEIGLLSVSSGSAEPLSPSLKTLLTNIGQQLGVVMDNAILFDETARRVTLSTDLGRLSLAISAQLERDAVLDLICRESLGVFDVQGAYIWLVNNQQLVGKMASGLGADRFTGYTLSLQDSHLLPVRVLGEWRPRYINDIGNKRILPAEFVEMTHARSVMAVPLVRADVPTGVLLLVNTQDSQAFGDWQTEQAGLFGVQIALALQNASLFEEVRHRLDQLRLVNEVGRYTIAILSPSMLVDGVARQLYGLLGYDTISVLHLENGALKAATVFVRGQPFPTDLPAERYASLQTAAKQAIQQSEPVILNQVCYLQPDIPHLSEPFDCCSLAVPLVLADEVSGAVVVERQGANSIGQEDLDVLEPLTAQLAISMSNARLFEQVRTQAITMEKRVVERTAEIKNQKDRIDAILLSVADAVIVFNLGGQVVMTNPVARTLFDEHDLDMDLGNRVKALVARMLAAGDSGHDATEKIQVGSIVLQAKAARLIEEGQVSGSVVVMRDISQLHEVDRMKDKFISTVSHELRTPLANLKLYLSLLQQGRPERYPMYVEVMEREIERLARLISDLLDISRMQGEQNAERRQIREIVDIENLAESVVHQHMAWADKERKELLYECLSSPLPTTYGDPSQLIRALTNLISNAITYTPEGGRIVVHCWAESARQNGPELIIIEVSDTGIGIPAQEIKNIFERFYRGMNVSPNIPGTGLGLAILKEIMDLHGGNIEVESQEGRGSTFRLKLPVIHNKPS